MKFCIITLLFIGNIMTAKTQTMPDEAAYNPAYEQVVQQNNIQKAHLVLRSSSEEEFNRNDTIYTVIYNEKGKPTSLTEPPIDEWDATYIDSFVYNNKGQLLSVVLKGYDMFDITHSYSYDKKGHIISSEMNGAEPRKYTYLYEKKKIKEVVGTTPYIELDEEGDFTDEVTWSVVERYEYQYSDMGQLSAFIYFYLDGVYSRTYFSYDTEGRLVEDIAYIGPEDQEDPFYTKTMYSFNVDGLLEGITDINAEGVSYTYSFVYTKR